MLIAHLFTKNIRTQITLPLQRLSITINITRSTSSSDSSSDSDDDSKPYNESKTSKSDKYEKKYRMITNYLERADALRRKRKIEIQISKTAEALIANRGENKEKLLSSFMSNVSRIQKKNIPHVTKNIEHHTYNNRRIGLTEEGSGMMQYEKREKKSRKFQAPSTIEMLINKSKEIKQKDKANSPTSMIRTLQDREQKAQIDTHVVRTQEPSVLSTLFDKEKKVDKLNDTMKETVFDKRDDDVYKYSTTNQLKLMQWKYRVKEENVQDKATMKVKDPVESSVIRMLSNTNNTRQTKFQHERNKVNSISEKDCTEFYPIFDDDFVTSTLVPELTVWNACEARELQFAAIPLPRNVYDEMIQWTEEGKLWKFPIDNEQGMDEEQNVHFSKHVFLEQHLTEWCPPKGPIRHFMELVCIGLSKNPHLTVKEKYDHIMWYKDYFHDKTELLQKLGLVE